MANWQRRVKETSTREALVRLRTDIFSRRRDGAPRITTVSPIYTSKSFILLLSFHLFSHLFFHPFVLPFPSSIFHFIVPSSLARMHPFFYFFLLCFQLKHFLSSSLPSIFPSLFTCFIHPLAPVLSIPPIHPTIHPSIHPSIHQSINQLIHPSIHETIYRSSSPICSSTQPTGENLGRTGGWSSKKFEVGAAHASIPPIYREVLLLDVRQSTYWLKQISKMNFLFWNRGYIRFQTVETGKRLTNSVDD